MLRGIDCERGWRNCVLSSPSAEEPYKEHENGKGDDTSGNAAGHSTNRE